MLQMQREEVEAPVGELDSAHCNWKIPHAATKTWCSQINKQMFLKKHKKQNEVALQVT